MKRLLPLAQHVVFSERGLSVIGADFEAGLRVALARGAAVAAVTRGERGVLWVEQESLAFRRTAPRPSAQRNTVSVCSDTAHNRSARSTSRASREERVSRQSTKYLPLIPETLSEVAR